MLGFFTAIYSGLAFAFACIGVVFVGYKLYQYFKGDAKYTAPNQEFENIRRERLEREEVVSQFARQSNLHLHHHAHQTVARFKDQQAHLEKSIADFDEIIEQTQCANSDLNDANSSLQNTIIKPMQALLARIKIHFLDTTSLVSSLSEGMTTATHSLAAREKEVKAVIENLAKSQSNISSLMEQMPKANLQAQYVANLEERNRELEEFQTTATPALVDLTHRCKKLLDIKNHQQRLIKLLQAQNQSDTTPHDCRLFGSGSPNKLLVTGDGHELDEEGISTELRADTAMMV